MGCEHGCLYCYSRSVLRDKDLALNWGRFVKAKVNVAERLLYDLKHKPKGVVGVSTVTDPYQPLEARFRLTRQCLEALSTSRFPVSIQTKSNLILMDRDLIRPESFEVGVTLTTMDSGLAEKLEPKASKPDARAQVVEEFSEKGVKTWIFLGPIIPILNDSPENIRRIVKVAQRSRSHIIYDKLNIKPWVMEAMESFLRTEQPQLLEQLPSLVGSRSERWHTIAATVESTCKELGVRCETAFSHKRASNISTSQVKLTNFTQTLKKKLSRGKTSSR